jgi:hypothetical protein
MSTNINQYTANVNGTQTPLINIYSDIFTYKDTNTNNLPQISTIPFTAQTNNGIAALDSSGGIILINPGIYKINMGIVVSQTNYNTQSTSGINMTWTTSAFNGTTNNWSNYVPLLYYDYLWPYTNPNLTISNVIGRGSAYNVGNYDAYNFIYNYNNNIYNNTYPYPPYINPEFYTNSTGEAYGNYLSVTYNINSKLPNQTIYFTGQVPGAGSATLYMGLVTATVQLINTTFIPI